MLNIKQKDKIIKEHEVHKGDTGSVEVQTAILTKEVNLFVLLMFALILYLMTSSIIISP